ncbi:rhamnan synthesis F family protein [Paracoccus methylarcula]|uniref:Glycosyl transferase n=1 Tax=Paracoccus methylarcula TaxID=72022 RepID=A0A422QS22_9RHOB|nr:rhamnan synthesis F family protein [Paracoccus methylarcula]RNF32794.1 hypothetical protein A7A09_020245 [Paracoccus methylarcula]
MLKRYFRPSHVSIVFHIFYEDVALNIIARLRNFRAKHKVYVTHSHDLSPEIMMALAKLTAPVRFLKVENIGMDVYPFLAAMEHFDLYNAGIICKLHTKRGEDIVGETWQSELFDSVLGNGARLGKNIEFMKANPQLLLVGADSTYLSAHKAMKDNFRNVSDINRTSLHADLEQDWGFFAGTIFIARSTIFKPLPPASMIRNNFSIGSTRGDGEYAHAYERIFGLLPRKFLGQVATVTPSWRGETISMTPSPSSELISRIMKDIHAASLLRNRDAV